MRRLTQTLLPESVCAETDKEDAHRLQRYEALIQEVARGLAGRIHPEHLPARRAGYVDLDTVRSRVETSNHLELTLLAEVLRFLRAAGPFEEG